MSEPVFFVVQRGPGGTEYPAIFYERLPDALTRKIPKGSAEKPPMVFVQRLDLLPDAERWLGLSLQSLYRYYLRLKAAGKLPPPNLVEPAKKSEAASDNRRQLGDWWSPPVVSWDQNQPFKFPDPDSIKPKCGVYHSFRHKERVAEPDGPTAGLGGDRHEAEC